LPTILADPIQLEQALDNLITNSIEAIREAQRGSRIILSARMEDGDTYIEVRDDGPGFAPGLESIATTPFMTTKRNGTGLGLAIARSVAEAHGGSLAVNARGTGASIRLRLPTSGK
jgi:signal transduction histidine kinase